MDWQQRMEALQIKFDEAHPFGRATVTFEPSGVTFQVDVAESPEQRARGMAGRSFADDVPAMLFVEPVETYAKFHMRNVTQPLVLAIFDKDGQFLESILMAAESTSVVHAHGFKYALEMSPEAFNRISIDAETLKISR